MSFQRRKKRSKKGASLIEAILAAFILIPIALAFLDVMCLVFANSVNDTAAKNCARAGANQPNVTSASEAATKCLATFQTSGIVKSIVIDDLSYEDNLGRCVCTTTMVVNVPVPFPGFSSMTFTNRAVEPIVGTADPTRPN